jgi:hypothetical protein
MLDSWSQGCAGVQFTGMSRVLVRLFAVVLILGQMVQVSGGAFCGLQRKHHARHCDDGMQQQAGTALSAPTQDMASGLCDLVGPCSAPIPAVAATPMSVDFALALVRDGASPAPASLASFTSAPIPPPPQA